MYAGFQVLLFLSLIMAVRGTPFGDIFDFFSSFFHCLEESLDGNDKDTNATGGPDSEEFWEY